MNQTQSEEGGHKKKKEAERSLKAIANKKSAIALKEAEEDTKTTKTNTTTFSLITLVREEDRYELTPKNPHQGN